MSAQIGALAPRPAAHPTIVLVQSRRNCAGSAHLCRQRPAAHPTIVLVQSRRVSESVSLYQEVLG
jgi:hypothetical protein